MTTHHEVRQINGKRVATPEYRAWQNMKNRCGNPRGQDYAYYGKRGIDFDPEWGRYKNFLRDMGRRPTPKHTLEPKNGSLGYCKDNCLWATRKTQSRNRNYVKLSLTLAADIRQLYATGKFKQSDIAGLFGVSPALVSQTVLYKVWL